MPFRNRQEAGRALVEALTRFREADPVVLALPRGGVTVAAEIATALAAPLDLVLVRKIGVPRQPELAMGAVVNGETPVIVRNHDVIAALAIPDDTFDAVCQRELAEIERRRERYLAGRAPIPIAGRTAIVVDDGIATGATMRAALRATAARGPRQCVLAVPVAAADTLRALAEEADETVCLEAHADLGAIGSYYLDFRQVSDDEVITLLAAAAKGTKPA